MDDTDSDPYTACIIVFKRHSLPAFGRTGYVFLRIQEVLRL